MFASGKTLGMYLSTVRLCSYLKLSLCVWALKSCFSTKLLHRFVCRVVNTDDWLVTTSWQAHCVTAR